MGLKFRLIVIKGLDEHKSFEFEQDEITIGRIVNNTLVLNDQTVSRKHACIKRYNNTFKITDMGSQNGIEHNGKKVLESVIENDDEITIGNTIFRFKFDKGQASPLPEDTVIVKKDKISPPHDAEIKDKADGAFKKISDMMAEGSEKSSNNPQENSGSERKETVVDLIDKISHDTQTHGETGKKNYLSPTASLFKKPVVKYPLIFFAVLIGVLVIVGKKNSDEVVKDADLSETPIELPAPGVYGINSRGDRAHPDKAIFTFNYEGKKAFLEFDEGGTDYDEVFLFLNGQKILSLPSSPNGWFKVSKYELPRECLVKGVNKLVFDNVFNPPKTDNWGVQNIKVYEAPYPDCDENVAQECLKLGDVRFKEKLVSYGNSYDAYKNFNKALDYLENCNPKPDFYFEVRQKKNLAAQYLDKEYQKHMLAALQANVLGNASLVKVELEIVLKLFPEVEDYRYQKAKQLLIKYGLN